MSLKVSVRKAEDVEVYLIAIYTITITMGRNIPTNIVFNLNFQFIFAYNNIFYYIKCDVYKYHESEMNKIIRKLFDSSKYTSLLSAYAVPFKLTWTFV